MDNLIIGIRAQDFHECLRVTGSFGPKDVHYKKTLLIGKAASLAMHLRGLLFIENVQQLEYAASSLGISSLELPAVLRELEEVDFISVVKTGDDIKRVDIRVPEFRSGYEDLGERWTQLRPSVIEQASLSALETLHYGPVSEEKLRKNLGLGVTEFAILNDVMKSGQLLVIQPVDGNPRHVLLAYLGAERFAHCLLEIVSHVQSQGGGELPRYARNYIYGGPLALKEKEQFFDLLRKATGTAEMLDPPSWPEVLELLNRLLKNPAGSSDMLRHITAAYVWCARMNNTSLPSLYATSPNTAAIVLAKDVCATFTNVTGLSEGIFSALQPL